jgi:DNA helicase HerA-like ATPase
VPVEEFDTNEPHIILGRVLSSIPEYSAKLYKSALFRHILITGTTGSGKSYTASKIADRLSKDLKIPVVIIDWHGEYQKLLPYHTTLNPREFPLQLFTGEPDDLSILTSIFELTPPQEYILEKILKRKDFVKLKTIDGLLETIEIFPEESTWFRESKLSLHRKLSVLSREEYSDLFKFYEPTNVTFNKLFLELDKPLLIDVSKIIDLSIKKLYASLLVKRIVNYATKNLKQLAVIIEEAQNYLSKQNPIKPICEMLREIRKFNIGLIVVAQSISQLVEDVMANTNTKIIHAVKSKQDLEVIEKAVYMEHSLLSLIPYLEVGEAVYSTISLKKPILIRIE